MATKHHHKFRKSKSLSACFPFPACFGRDRSPAKKSPRNAERKKLPWWARLRARKSGRKTVPVDSSVVEDSPRRPDKREEIKEEIVALDGKCLVPAGGVDKARKGPDPDVPSKHDTCHKSLSPARKPDCRKSGSSRPRSPDPKPSRRRVLTSCSTFPPPGRKRLQPVGVSRLAGSKPTHSPGAEVAAFRRSDAVIGMTVLMVSLAFLMLWGRTCAVVCTSAWFYFVPRLRRAMDTEGDAAGETEGGGELDVDSSEYKKKVIMAGLLQRNRR